ncbi:MAG TPA: hypothetical protein VGB04_03660 [Allosphingosinicella sp.]|jgi:hypothetical protein
MSYLETPHFTFYGHFQADTSTVNNDVRHYSIPDWEDRFQDPQNGAIENGWWNPDGTNSFRLLDLRVTGAATTEGAAAADDPVLGLAISSNPDTAPAKIVDLDPQFQMGSSLWGLQLVLSAGGVEYLRGDFEPAPFRDLFFGRNEGMKPNSNGASAKFTSRLVNLVWGDAAAGSAFLAALKAVADANGDALSVSLTTFSYNNQDPNAFSYGQVIGAIGPWQTGEPRSFVGGRRFVAADSNGGFSTSTTNIGFFDAVVAQGKLYADLGGALPMVDRSGAVPDLGTLTLALLTAPDTVGDGPNGVTLGAGTPQNATVSPGQFAPIGTIAYQQSVGTLNWLTGTSGLVGFDLPTGLATGTLPLALISTQGGVNTVVIRETLGGFFVRADDFEQRVDSVASGFVQVPVTLHCYQYGQPLSGPGIQLQLGAPQSGAGTGQPTAPDQPRAAVPVIGKPQSAIIPNTPPAAKEGVVAATILVGNPGGFRKYIDGQIYMIGYAFGFTNESPSHPLDLIVLHVRDAFEAPAQPAWSDVEPILRQFGNLYPVMSKRLFSFTDEPTLRAQANLLHFALAKSMEDPNYMPATRDLSRGKRETLLAWLRGGLGLAAAPAAPDPDVVPAQEALNSAAAAAAPAREALPGLQRFTLMKAMDPGMLDEAGAAGAEEE